ncbi:zinc-binding alcohol dehydrogenase family protein [Leuconostoc gelidum]|uniref:zinc-binding alcohol dehydrogenase family protein n=1 Tax=Leuconostoc gelidum TaxID=1244 RepID=UPI00027E6A25|nr:zinc-binding alcohol dehydrogenase family protein [Leuconostoc gelidum]AFS39558.1 zinc-containing alcohol dehydrogenase (oxidoreductase) [Leuconostoc gelidum JB7]MBZ5991386.1 zinc-binding alcohol dehydrogenase family protein [Leuconostoc gelidum subsp. gelidum]USP17276.1 zinc-binding alcohol dehydrogenase family protein [Leuconostoc gelidum subsp. aenigmaticum]
MNSIKAVGFDQHLSIDNPDSFQDININVPEAHGHDLLIRVDGVSVNPVDTFVRKSGRKNRLSKPKIIGWDAVGVVINTGNDVTLFKKGDRVWYAGDFTRSGSNAQLQLVDERIVGLAPKRLNDEQAAAVPLVGLTAYESLFEKMGINWSGNEHKTLLIINGAGGVGSMAIQLAKLAGLTVIATASREESISWAKKMGADQVINHRQDLVSQVRKLNQKYVDYILNLNNLDAHWNEIAELIKPDGQIVATTENHRLIDLQKLTKKRATFAWEWMYSKSYFKTATMTSQNQILNHLAKLYMENALLPINTINYPLINAFNMRKAHADVETGSMIGKVVLTGWGK